MSAGIAHRAEQPWLRSQRSEIGHPRVDRSDFGVELGTLHRLVETVGIRADPTQPTQRVSSVEVGLDWQR